MNKKLLALAIAAGMSLPVAASADVKIFGTITAETGEIDHDNTNVDVTTMGGTNSNSGAIFGGGNNALGVKGTEKLGNGLTAYFKINQSFSTFNGGTAFGARDRFVGVKGDGWHVQFGRMNTNYKAASVAYDPFLTTGGQSRASGAMSGEHNSYGDDLMEVGFKSGAWSGSFQLSWEDSTNDNDNSGFTNGSGAVDSGSWSGAIKYAANNWELGFAYLNRDYEYGGTAGTAASVSTVFFGTAAGAVTATSFVITPATAATAGTSGDADAWKIHGKYSMNGFTFMAQYEDVDADNDAAAGGSQRMDGAGTIMGGVIGTAEQYDSLHLAMTYKFSDSTELQAKYANTDWEDVRGVAGADVDGDHWGIGVKHSLSKRTSVYGNYTSNDYDWSRSSGMSDDDLDVWVVGLRHNF